MPATKTELSCVAGFKNFPVILEFNLNFWTVKQKTFVNFSNLPSCFQQGWRRETKERKADRKKERAKNNAKKNEDIFF